MLPASDSVNPTLRLWYGSPDAPILELKPRIPLTSVLSD